MVFNSAIFVVFAVVFYGIWMLLPTLKSRLALIVIGSLIFYGWWDWRYTFLLLAQGLLDFVLSKSMPAATPRRKKLLLGLAVGGNLSTLFYFKYLSFITVSLADIVGVFSTDAMARMPIVAAVVLPVGISFYTFQSMAYSIDVYRGNLKPASSALEFFAYLAVFPQLVAGPIERATNLLPQLQGVSNPTWRRAYEAWELIVIGLAKKILIADNLAGLVEQGFGNHQGNGALAWLGAIAFAIQIYCDFSGYSDMARGFAKLMNLELMVNFRNPYGARGLGDFWRRWHISLSTFFRDYVYIPLGGARVWVALWATFLLSGLWHGAAWTFLVWGLIHATMLEIERRSQWHKKVPGFVAHLGTLLVVLLGWVFFRCSSMSSALDMLRCMMSPTSFGSVPLGFGNGVIVQTLILALAIAVFALGFFDRLKPHLGKVRVFALPVLAAASILLRGPTSGFIYFHF